MCPLIMSTTSTSSVNLDNQPLPGWILEPVQFVTRVHCTARVSEHCAPDSAVVAHVSVLDLAEVEARHQVKQSPELVLRHPDTAGDVQHTGGGLGADGVAQWSVMLTMGAW